MTDHNQKAATSFDSDSFDWNNYDLFRPEYPSILFAHLFNYHKRNGGQWKLACDFGSGSGTILPELLSRFQKVIGSDVSAPQLQDAAKRFADDIKSKKIELHPEPAGKEPCDWIPDGEADLFVAAEAVHWFDRPAWYQQAAKKLKSGGTIAYWFYSTKPLIYTHPQAEEAWAKLHTRCE